MAFIPSVRVLETPLTGKTVKIQDTTGDVGVSGNTTGYGQVTSPAQTTPLFYGFLAQLFTALTWTQDKVFTAASLSGIKTTGVSITALNLWNKEVFPDGVITALMLPYTAGSTYTMDVTKKILTLTGVNTLDYVNAGYEYVTFITGGTTAVTGNIAIDVDATITLNDATKLVLKAEAPAVGPTVYLAKPAIFRFLELAEGNKCIVQSIGKLTEDNLQEVPTEDAMCKLIQWQLAAKIKFQCSEYAEAHTVVQTLNLKCGAGCTGC